MNTGQKTIGVLVMLVAVLLAGRQRPTEARVASGPTQPYVVQVSYGSSGSNNGAQWLYRLWSDGAVDKWRITPISPGNISTVWWGWVPLNPVQRADLNADGCIDAADLSIMLADWCSVAGGNPCGTCGL